MIVRCIWDSIGGIKGFYMISVRMDMYLIGCDQARKRWNPYAQALGQILVYKIDRGVYMREGV